MDVEVKQYEVSETGLKQFIADYYKAVKKFEEIEKTQIPQKTVSRAEAMAILKQVKSSFISLRLDASAKMQKGGRSGVTSFLEATQRIGEKFRKESQYVALIGTDVTYEKLVTNRLNKLGHNQEDFKVGKMTWGENVDNVEKTHTGKDGIFTQYLIGHIVSKAKPKVSYSYDGESVELTDVEKSYLPKKYGSKKQMNAGLKEEDTIIRRDPKMETIKGFVHNKVSYTIQD